MQVARVLLHHPRTDDERLTPGQQRHALRALRTLVHRSACNWDCTGFSLLSLAFVPPPERAGNETCTEGTSTARTTVSKGSADQRETSIRQIVWGNFFLTTFTTPADKYCRSSGKSPNTMISFDGCCLRLYIPC